MNDYGRLAHEEKVLLTHVLEHQKITRKQAVELLGVQRTKATEIILGLTESNILIRRGQGRGTYYELAKKNNHAL